MIQPIVQYITLSTIPYKHILLFRSTIFPFLCSHLYAAAYNNIIRQDLLERELKYVHWSILQYIVIFSNRARYTKRINCINSGIVHCSKVFCNTRKEWTSKFYYWNCLKLKIVFEFNIKSPKICMALNIVWMETLPANK